MKDLVNIYLMQNLHQVPSGITVLKAFEMSGYSILEHCGCTSGVCGACTCLIKKVGYSTVKPYLACQTKVEEGMRVTFPTATNKKFTQYNIDKINKNNGILSQLYFEIYNCVNCGKCTFNCPQKIDVRKCVEQAKYGDVNYIAKQTFSCIACGSCQLNCPAKIPHSELFMLARKVNSKRAKKSMHLQQTLKTSASADSHQKLNKLVNMSINDLKELYKNRKIEK